MLDDAWASSVGDQRLIFLIFIQPAGFHKFIVKQLLDLPAHNPGALLLPASDAGFPIHVFHLFPIQYPVDFSPMKRKRNQVFNQLIRQYFDKLMVYTGIYPVHLQYYRSFPSGEAQGGLAAFDKSKSQTPRQLVFFVDFQTQVNHFSKILAFQAKSRTEQLSSEYG